MNFPNTANIPRLRHLLTGDLGKTGVWMTLPPASFVAWSVLWIILGAGLYGCAIGYWRSPLQAVYNTVKFPLILLITALANSFLNAALAPLLGVRLNWRESLAAILLSFNLLAAILAAFSPLTLFLIWNLPPPDAPARATSFAYSLMLVSQSLVIAFAGIAANLRLRQLLESITGSRPAASRLLVAWLAANLLLGAQLAWICRPFFGRPNMEVQFFREEAFAGNFFESFFFSLTHIFHR